METLNDKKYYLFYEMMIQFLKNDDVTTGINQSLLLLKTFLASGNVVLYKKNDTDNYAYYTTDNNIQESIKPITYIVNKTSSLIENKSIFNFEINISDDLKDMIFLHLKTVYNDYILSISNYNRGKFLNDSFYKQLKDTMQIILKVAETYERNKRAISIDLLTGLDNRNSYEIRLQNINEADSNLVYGIFDLFRLKYINDNYGHAIGDIYIKETAKVLSKYWPKQEPRITNNVETMVDTGHCVYRIGGDEFVLLTNQEQLELTKLKASLAADEVSILNLGIEDKPLIGLNYGVIKHTPGDFIKDTYIKADTIMSDDKKKMYLKYGLERRQK